MSPTRVILGLTVAVLGLAVALPGAASAAPSELASAGAIERAATGVAKKKKRTVRKKVKIAVGQPGSVTLARVVLTVGTKKTKKKRSTSGLDRASSARDVAAKKRRALPKPRLKIGAKALPAGASATVGVWRHKKKKNKWVAIVTVMRPLDSTALSSARALSGAGVELTEVPINGVVTGALPPGEFFTFTRNKPEVFVFDEPPTEPNLEACFENRAGKLTGPGFQLLGPSHKRVKSFGKLPATPNVWTAREASIWNVDAACEPSANPSDYNDEFWPSAPIVPKCMLTTNAHNFVSFSLDGVCDVPVSGVGVAGASATSFGGAPCPGNVCLVNSDRFKVEVAFTDPLTPGGAVPVTVDGHANQAPLPNCLFQTRPFDATEDFFDFGCHTTVSGFVVRSADPANPISNQFNPIGTAVNLGGVVTLTFAPTANGTVNLRRTTGGGPFECASFMDGNGTPFAVMPGGDAAAFATCP